ncbi:hydantoinase/carbamoylase family amidase [Xylophilus ampelinus]|uniref:N-carbamoyl-L-amino-acid hydrolase n=1 Tax=Xylophilus ampelinus TaxID=54067 RepID=A0A318SXX9_9BURK|nr:hydantoinase/carbamoylase family amidase [Xylophilus ampelinus]MCS4509086.1 hydantoinase/carbamoylase family amidase [Xylophilus ampelinus]PYE79887.1 N-carbamoyl-L-amino-acid hydrolase [Xylophilus ampelinus]
MSAPTPAQATSLSTSDADASAVLQAVRPEALPAPALLDLAPQRDWADALLREVADATHDGTGITRESYGGGEERALCILERNAASLGFVCSRDRAQNLWMRLAEDTRTDPAVVIGSHADSVPRGGNYDGLAGIVAGMLVLVALRGRHTDAPPVQVLALRGEESAWYGMAYIGSLSMLGRLPVDALALHHRNGHGTLGEAMARCGADVAAIRRGEPLLDGRAVAAYLELHIEQGPVMVARGWPATVVTGIRGNLRHNSIRCLGETGHSGAVPRWLRKDALLAVAELLSRMDEHWRVLLQMGMDLVMTTGICSTPAASQAVSVIPGEVQFSFEARSQDSGTLDRFYALMRDECTAIAAARGVTFEFDARLVTAPATMDAGWIDRLAASADAQGGPPLERMPSGAGHDAAVFANAGIPSAMVFVRNAHGSHNPRETMDLDDFMRAASVLAGALPIGSVV